MADDTRDKLFSRTEYRRVIAWPERIRRESPFLASIFDAAESRRMLDVGCGTGEHTRHLADEGWVAVGLDVAEHMIEDAQGLTGPGRDGGSARYELRDAATAAELPEAPFGAAICLGNTLAFQPDADVLASLFAGVAAALAPGARFLIQLLNYEKILASGQRNLGLNFRPLPAEEGDGEIVFLRVMTPRDDGAVDFYPITLTLKPDADPPVELRSAKKGKHTAWKREQLEPALAAAGFSSVRALGGMADIPFSPLESPDLVLIATK